MASSSSADRTSMTRSLRPPMRRNDSRPGLALRRRTLRSVARRACRGGVRRSGEDHEHSEFASELEALPACAATEAAEQDLAVRSQQRPAVSRRAQIETISRLVQRPGQPTGPDYECGWT